MRCSTSSKTFLLGSDFAGATRSAYVTSGIGAPNFGVASWHSRHRCASTVSTSQGMLPLAPFVPSPDGALLLEHAATTTAAAGKRSFRMTILRKEPAGDPGPVRLARCATGRYPRVDMAKFQTLVDVYSDSIKTFPDNQLFGQK